MKNSRTDLSISISAVSLISSFWQTGKTFVNLICNSKLEENREILMMNALN